MRRISTGVTGRELLGNYVSFKNTLSTLVTNQDIVLTPAGSGETKVNSNLRIDSENALIFNDASGDNNVSIELAEISSNYSLTLPPDLGSAGNVLTVDGSGNLSFSDLTIEVSNQSADTSEYYPLLSTSDSGSISSVDTSSSKFYFTPNDGTLYASVFDGSFTGDGSNLTSVTAGNVDVSQDSSTDSTFYPTFVSSTSGTRSITTDNSMTYNPNSGEFSAPIVTGSSDISLKTDFMSISNAYETISKMEGKKYVRKSTGLDEVGLVAQDVEEILPEVVYTGENGLKSIAYGNIVAYLIEALKEQKKEIDNLKKARG